MTATAHPLFARLYHRLRAWEDALNITETRRELLAGLAGRVVEVGAGDGANFAYYTQQVTEVVAVEPEPYLRRMAAAAATGAPVPVTVVDGTAETLPLDDSSCDAAVASLVLCSVRDPRRAAAELRRVLRPNGELRFYEHVLADHRRLARLQRLGAPVHSLIAGGCRPDRDTLRHLQGAGFRIEQLRRFDFQLLPFLVLSKPHVLGTARRPAAAASTGLADTQERIGAGRRAQGLRLLADNAARPWRGCGRRYRRRPPSGGLPRPVELRCGDQSGGIPAGGRC